MTDMQILFDVKIICLKIVKEKKRSVIKVFEFTLLIFAFLLSKIKAVQLTKIQFHYCFYFYKCKYK